MGEGAKPRVNSTLFRGGGWGWGGYHIEGKFHCILDEGTISKVNFSDS